MQNSKKPNSSPHASLPPLAKVFDTDCVLQIRYYPLSGLTLLSESSRKALGYRRKATPKLHDLLFEEGRILLSEIVEGRWNRHLAFLPVFRLRRRNGRSQSVTPIPCRPVRAKITSHLDLLFFKTSVTHSRSNIFEQLLDAFPGFVFVKDKSLKFRFVNRLIATSHGMSKSQMLNQTEHSSTPDKDEEAHFHAEDRIVLLGKERRILEETYTPPKTGERNRMHLTTFKSRIQTACLTGRLETFVAGIATDITPLIRDLDEADELLSKLADKMLTEEQIHQQIANHVWRKYQPQGFHGVYLVRHFPSLRQFIIHAVAPTGNPSVKADCGFMFNDNEGICGHMFNTSKSFDSSNLNSESIKPLKNWKATSAAPIWVGNQFWGALCVNSRTRLLPHVTWRVKQELERYAKRIANICALADLFSARRGFASIDATLFSIAMEAHDIDKELWTVLGHVQMLHREVSRAMASKTPKTAVCTGDMVKRLSSLVTQLDRVVKWADVCRDWGKFIRHLKDSPEKAIDDYRTEAARSRAFGDVSLDEALERAVRNAETEAQKHRASCKIITTAKCVIHGQQHILEHAFYNQVLNAIQWGSVALGPGKTRKTRDNVKVEVRTSVRSEAREVDVIIAHDGFQMKPDLQERLNYFFNNLGNPNVLTASLPGFGSLVTAFAAYVHGGRISVGTSDNHWTEMMISLPFLKQQ